VLKVLSKHGFTSRLAKEALEVARERGAFTVFAVVDALTRLASRLQNAGDRSEADTKAAALLAHAV
jgi:predicted GNAT family acetyltransferase